jgi:hypothetical protein
MIGHLPAPSEPAPGHSAPGRPASRRLPLTSARRAILAVGVPVAIGLIGAVAFSLVADIGTDSYPVKYSIPISDGRLSVNLGGGTLTMQGTDAGTGGPAHLAGTVDYSLVRPHVSLTDPDGQGAIFTIACRAPTGNCGLNSSLSLPAGTAATIATDGGDLTATDLAGYSSLSTGGGDLTATDLTGYASLQTGGGDLTAADLDGTLNIGTSGGNITATSIDSQQVTADSGGGDIEIVFTRVPQNVQVTADGGNVTIVVPSGPTTYDITTNTDGGNLNNSVPLATSSSHIITTSSGGGDITIEQSP